MRRTRVALPSASTTSAAFAARTTPVSSCRSGGLYGPNGLTAGKHVLRIVSLGETLPEAANWPTNYERNEVHLRSFVVVYE